MGIKKNTESIYLLKKTRKGLFALLILFVILAISPRFYYSYFYSPPIYEITQSEIAPQEKKSKKKSSPYTIPDNAFNPNTYTEKQWMAIGLSKKQSASIIHYIASGAVLKTKDDVAKLYGISPELFQLLKPKIDLPDKRSNAHPFSENTNTENMDRWKANTTDKNKIITPIEINIASKKQLLSIKGIGSFYAEEIIELRNKFGGFVSLKQLLQIYNIDKEKLAQISPYIIIDKEHIHQLNINTASQSELQKHPWISRDLAKSIVYFRENYKKYTQLDQLLLSPYINTKQLKKLRPYLTVSTPDTLK